MSNERTITWSELTDEQRTIDINAAYQRGVAAGLEQAAACCEHYESQDMAAAIRNMPQHTADTAQRLHAEREAKHYQLGLGTGIVTGLEQAAKLCDERADTTGDGFKREAYIRAAAAIRAAAGQAETVGK